MSDNNECVVDFDVDEAILLAEKSIEKINKFHSDVKENAENTEVITYEQLVRKELSIFGFTILPEKYVTRTRDPVSYLYLDKVFSHRKRVVKKMEDVIDIAKMLKTRGHNHMSIAGDTLKYLVGKVEC